MHQHKYEAKRPEASVLVCACGKFRHVITAETEIVSQIQPMPESHCEHGYRLTRDCYRCGREIER